MCIINMVDLTNEPVLLLQDKTLRLNELNALRKQIEREYLEKVELEDQIMEKMRSQLTMDKAAQYTKKLTGKQRELTKSLVSTHHWRFWNRK